MEAESRVSGGAIIKSVVDKVNQLEGILARQSLSGVSEAIDKCQTIFPQVIECLGEGKIIVDEAVVLSDSSLNLCRLGLLLPGNDAARKFVFSEFACNILCILLTGHYIKEISLVKSVSERCIRMIDAINAGDPQILTFWQCLIRLAAKNSTLSDDDRFQLLTGILSVVSKMLPTSLDPKWIQLLRAALRLCKYVLRKLSISDSSAHNGMLLAAESSKDEELVRELGIVPVKEFHLDNGPSAWLVGCLRREKWPPESLGKRLLELGSGPISINDLFSGDRSLSNDTFRNWHLLPVEKSNNLRLWHASLLGSATFDKGSCFKLAERSIVLASPPFSRDLAITLSLLRKLLSQVTNPKDLLQRTPLLIKFVFLSQLRAKFLKPFVTDLWIEAGNFLSQCLAHELLDFAFWSLMAMVNIAKECPRADFHKGLRCVCVELIKKKNLSQNRNLKLVASKGLLVSLSFIGKSDEMEEVIQLLDFLGPLYAIKLLSMSPFVSCSTSILCENLVKRALLDVESINQRILKLECLKMCEYYLRFAQDVSIFETSLPSGLQEDLVSFLQRSKVNTIEIQNGVADLLSIIRDTELSTENISITVPSIDHKMRPAFSHGCEEEIICTLKQKLQELDIQSRNKLLHSLVHLINNH